MRIKKDNVFLECGCCGQYHPIDFVGDCRDDSNRFLFEELPKNYKIYSLEAQTEQGKLEEDETKQTRRQS